MKLLLWATLIGSTLAAPAEGRVDRTTHRVRRIANGLDVSVFSPPSIYKTFGQGIDHPLSKRAEPADVKEISVSFVSSQLGVNENEIIFKTSFTDDAAAHAYLKQSIDGVEVANAVANVALNANGKVVTFGANFVKPDKVSSSETKITSADAISAAEQKLEALHTGYPISTEFYAKDDGSVVLTYAVQVEGKDDHRLEAFVDAQTGEIIAVNDFTAHSAFLAIPIRKQGLNDGQELIENPEDRAASPDGWNTGSNGTMGNNLIACKHPFETCTPANITVQSAPGLVFNYPADDSQEANITSNLDAARTNAFYVANTVHDIQYRYGFTEASYNFQTDNFGKGGLGNDSITVYVQDDNDDNALFAAGPDGDYAILKLYIWTDTNPGRDGALQNDIIAHECTHGLTLRLTGGGTARCLQTLESVGLAEGWSDAFAEWTEQTPEIHDWTTGSYVSNNPAGKRSVPYSTNKTIDPLMYGDLQRLDEPHDMGEVWATVLHDIHAALVGAYGFSQDAFTNPDGAEGNVVFMHLFVDHLSIQPCNPTFLQTRDAFVQADVNRYNGANRCLLWKAFAGRGLGMNAANYTNDATVPDGC